MKETFEIEKVKFGRKVVDQGVILGKRPWKWTLGRKYSPCHAKDLTQKCNISALSPHKSNFVVYIPSAFLEVGQVIHIVNKEYKKERIEKTVKVLTVTPQFIETELIEAEHREEEENPSEEELTQEYAWKMREVRNEYLTDPEEENFDNYVITESQVITDDFQDVIETDETPNTKHQTQGAYIMSKKQTGFVFIYETAPKEQKSLFDLDLFTVEPEREILTLTEPEKDESKPVKIDYTQYGMFRPEYERKERKNNLEKLPLLQTQQTPDLPKETLTGFSPDEIAILTALMSDKPKQIDELYAETRIPAGLLSASLMMLEMKNKIAQKAGKMFIRV